MDPSATTTLARDERKSSAQPRSRSIMCLLLLAYRKRGKKRLRDHGLPKYITGNSRREGICRWLPVSSSCEEGWSSAHQIAYQWLFDAVGRVQRVEIKEEESKSSNWLCYIEIMEWGQTKRS